MRDTTVYLLTKMYYRPRLDEFTKERTIPFTCKSAMMRYLKQGMEINKAYDVQWSKSYENRVDNMLDYKTISTDDREMKVRYYWEESLVYNNNKLP
jgi:hypothetical protein